MKRLSRLPVAFMLGLILSGKSQSHEGYDSALASLCEARGRQAPGLLEPTCLNCHTDPAGGGSRNASGKIYESGDPERITRFFCPSASEQSKGVWYNGQSDGALPATWQPSPPPKVNYEGSLESYWLADLEAEEPSQWVSSGRAKALKAGPLIAAPDNCWGHAMNFGLIRLNREATLTVVMTPDEGSDIIPGFALYQGWDQGASSSRDATILFGKDEGSPLGTTGLSFLGDRLGETPGAAISANYDLPAGNYELFVTVGQNISTSGSYRIELRTSPYGNGDGDTLGHAQCGTANNRQFVTPGAPTPSELCEKGTPGAVIRATGGRFTWPCFGLKPEAINRQCYTLGTNGKANPPELYMLPGSMTVESGQIVNQTPRGGRGGTGGTGYRLVKPIPKGLSCKLSKKGDTAIIRVTGEGSCPLVATQRGDRTYNDTQSGPILIHVRKP